MNHEPERRMLVAMLEDAIDELLVGGLAQPGTQRRESERWIVSGDRRSPFSFVNVCEALFLDPSAVRKQVLALARARTITNSRRRFSSDAEESYPGGNASEVLRAASRSR